MAVYINPAYVVTLRPDPVNLDQIGVVKLEDGETLRVLGEHREVADKVARRPTGPTTA